ncbi:hypothetical protein [Actinomadura verrucosospora]|uniref:Uncharacterized protein n=1 Tax=Actinomadura verrucosospora TaxID=46165 RepID=A0A7D3ZCT2_ACTVE|nr:hypothetical protein [Actinomadura verrucosospora]QKG19297.1 hypothetical protein ACTIVE_0933 [Actinomadura verrucosospora]
MDGEVLRYYERGEEDRRLREGDGRLELWRTQDVLRRVLPAPPARVVDVGGGPGVHAEWLAADGHEVELVDPVPLHVERAARIPGVTARPPCGRRPPRPPPAVGAAWAGGGGSGAGQGVGKSRRLILALSQAGSAGSRQNTMPS